MIINWEVMYVEDDVMKSVCSWGICDDDCCRNSCKEKTVSIFAPGGEGSLSVGGRGMVPAESV